MNFLKTAILISLLFSATLTGCKSDSGVNANAKYNSEGKKTETGDHKVDSDSLGIDLDAAKKDYKTDLFTQMDFVFDTDQSVSEVGVEINTGNITIAYSGDNKTGLSLEYTVYADTDEVCQEVKSHLNATAETNGSRLDLKLIEDKTGENIDNWLKKNIPDCRVECDLYITVPKFVKSFNAKETVGNISFGELSGKFSADVNVGNICCNGTGFTEASELKCIVGNIDLMDCTYKADTDISADTGNISFGLPTSGSGGAKLKVAADTGNIMIKGNGSYDVSDEKKNGTSHSMTISVEDCIAALSVKSGEITKE